MSLFSSKNQHVRGSSTIYVCKPNFLFSFLQSVKLLLLFYLTAQFLLRGHIGKIFCGKQLVAAVQHGIVGYIFICVGTEQKANGRAMSFGTHQFIIHLHIHVHLTNVLMTQFGCLQVNEHEATQMVVIENKVDVVVFLLGMDVLLSVHKSKALAQFHEERDEMVDDADVSVSAFRHAQELCLATVANDDSIAMTHCAAKCVFPIPHVWPHAHTKYVLPLKTLEV